MRRRPPCGRCASRAGVGAKRGGGTSRAPGAARPTATHCPISGSPASRSTSASAVTTVPAPDRVPHAGQTPPRQIRLSSLWQPRHSFVVVVTTTTKAAAHLGRRGLEAMRHAAVPGRGGTGPATGIRAKLSRRALDMLPPGTLAVGAGLLVLGAGYYTHLAVAGHSLPATGMAALSVLWSIVFLLGLGVFLPIEQELIRLVAARMTVGEGIAPVVRRACAQAAVLLAVILVPVAAAAGPLAGRLFGGDTAMVTVLGCACVALAVTAVSRGTLAGLGRFGGYGGQLAIDGGLRAAAACALGLAGSHSAVAFGLILAVGPLLAAAVMARIPLFVFTSLQTSLLPGLAGAIAAGDRARFRLLLYRSCGVVKVLGIACGLPATILGPWLTQVLFGARPVLGNAAFGWLAFGTLCYMLAMVLGQGAMALSRHRDQLLSWLAGAAVLAVITTAPGEVTMRVVTAYGAGCATVAVVLAVVLLRHSHATGQHARGRARAWPTTNQ